VVRMTSVIVFESTVDVAMCFLISMKIFSISIVSSQVICKNKMCRLMDPQNCEQAIRQPGAKHSVCGGHPHPHQTMQVFGRTN
jgi:hypothetical protein